MLRIESDDKVEFILRYLPSLVSAFLACVVMVIVFVFLKRKRVKHLNWKTALLSLLVPVLIWAVYFVLTAKWTLTLTLLNSENEQGGEPASLSSRPPAVEDQRLPAKLIKTLDKTQNHAKITHRLCY